MVEYYLEHGISLKVTPARTPKMNGITKRTNGMLIIKMRIMLIDALLLLTY